MDTVDFSKAKQLIRSKLPEYLEEKGFPIKGSFNCINPAHSDNSPSMNLLPDQVKVFCHGCHAIYDIFGVYSLLENKPAVGSEWYRDNFTELARKYELNVPPPSEEDQWRFTMYRMLSDIYEYITMIPFEIDDLALQEIQRRGWPEEMCRTHGIGVVGSWDRFYKYITGLYSVKQLQDAGIFNIKNPNEPFPVFRKGMLIFTTKDEAGRPVGFVGRNLETKEGEAKYIGTRTKDLKLDVFKKVERLYSLHNYLRRRQNSAEPLYIVEGQADVMSALVNGSHRFVAVGKNRLSEQQVEKLIENNISNVIIAFDGDAGGKQGLESLVDTILVKQTAIRARILEIPEEKDPDDYIRIYGIDKFLSLPTLDIFEWRLERFSEDEDVESICGSIIPTIAADASPIIREHHCRRLAERTGFSFDAIKAELDRYIEENKSRTDDKVTSIVNLTTRRALESPLDADLIFQAGIDKILGIRTASKQSTLDNSSSLQALDLHKKISDDPSITNNPKVDLTYEFANKLGNSWYNGRFILIGGKANTGKTTLLTQFAYEIAELNEDVCVIIFYLDDDEDVLINRLITLDILQNQTSGLDPRVTQNNISAIASLETKDIDLYRFLKPMADHSYNSVKNLVLQDRLIFKDSRTSNSIQFIDSVIAYYRKKYKDRKIVAIIDNFHDTTTEEGHFINDTAEVTAKSKFMKGNIATRKSTTIFASIQYTKIKPFERPSNNSAADARALQYDPKAIIHLYSDLSEHESVGTEDNCQYYFPYDSQKLPIIEMNFGKNKLSSYKGTMTWVLYPDQGKYVFLPPGDNKQYKENN